MIGKIIITCLLFPLSAAAQETENVDSASTKTSFSGRLHQLQQFLDNKARASVDPHYIEVPEKPWRVILRGKETAFILDYENSIEFPDINERADWKLSFTPPVSASVGFWVGYRGTGISFSKSLVKNAGRNYSFSTTGAKYGFNFRLRRFNTDAYTLDATDYQDGKAVSENHFEGNLQAPVWIRSVYINGYYVFNGRRYSQAAAYNQSVIQRRSAGSLLVGATWYQSSFDYSDIMNIDFMLLSNNMSRIKVHQANIGVGYGFNWVPLRGLVVNAMAMPTISVYNRVKVYRFDCNYYVPSTPDDRDDYGQWDHVNHRWENGATHKPMPITPDENGLRVYDQFDMWEVEPETVYSAFRLNLDLRLGLAYNWKNCFIGLQVQYNNFTYKKDECKVSIYDAYARASLGVRF